MHFDSLGSGVFKTKASFVLTVVFLKYALSSEATYKVHEYFLRHFEHQSNILKLYLHGGMADLHQFGKHCLLLNHQRGMSGVKGLATFVL